MSRRSRPSGVRLHLHCESCFSRRCRAPVEVSVSCLIIPCRLLCGALFHLCKEEEHSLLCPNERAPCLNAAYGCPIVMPRSWLAAHLQVCPASVVCCSMEWLRWPTDDTDIRTPNVLHENLLKEEGSARDLDLATALDDQERLYSRLKMKNVYPELMEKEEEEEEKEEEKEKGATGGLTNGKPTQGDDGGPLSPLLERSDEEEREEKEPKLEQKKELSTDKYNMMERMFSMERGGCAVASRQEPKSGEGKEGGRGSKDKDSKGEEKMEANGEVRGEKAGGSNATGLAPWDEGVMERLGQELSPQEFNMYMVHNGRMLLTFGQIEACTPRDRDFVYGSLEPIPVQTLHSFKIPDSYHYKPRTQLYETMVKHETKEAGVDTADLGGDEETWNRDEAAITLLGYAEIEVMGHKISEGVGTYGLYVDVGTQTHSFPTAPFERDTVLADVMVGRPLKLRLQLQVEGVTSRHNKASSAFTFLCGHSFLRREFPAHFRNVHADIQMCLSGWFEQRCPLAYLGCTYSQRRFQPSTHRATVTYNQELSIFNLRPTVPDTLAGASQPPQDPAKPPRRRAVRGGVGLDSLSTLPYEVLCHIASFLDSLSLSQLALVSRFMREVCSSQLQGRGMITLRWEKKTYSHGGATWRPKTVWEFSHLFSSVKSWHFANVPSITAHLKVCPYYHTAPPREPVALPSMSESQGGSQERESLVTHFMLNR
ncbi:F-box only protein 40-like [Osmerus eperlanus]|uniref:F-box only protein 40-like n=1 Tax=Osmerus eperlanus TaxID=29151 RepID=UPI002E119496